MTLAHRLAILGFGALMAAAHWSATGSGLRAVVVGVLAGALAGVVLVADISGETE